MFTEEQAELSKTHDVQRIHLHHNRSKLSGPLINWELGDVLTQEEIKDTAGEGYARYMLALLVTQLVRK
jgi:hypothetical protein